ncbi:hypothetical protein CMV_024998 [Castanea mollissima]|uniref:Secreted protein n=1 Tax=Castanea mollissima TaxID=60419 RepID=A0A8J4QGY7_9ROSI|nr:hypothetical protein CMV_024998 [Castanea mollissima]
MLIFELLWFFLNTDLVNLIFFCSFEQKTNTNRERKWKISTVERNRARVLHGRNHQGNYYGAASSRD